MDIVFFLVVSDTNSLQEKMFKNRRTPIELKIQNSFSKQTREKDKRYEITFLNNIFGTF